MNRIILFLLLAASTTRSFAQPTPVVNLTSPTNGTVQSAGGSVFIQATASESGGTITKVEFFANSIKIGEAVSAPYSMSWANPASGNYLISAKATDNLGVTATASVNVKIQSLSNFWSTVGNTGVGGDTSFIGTVDSNRLAFRTNNLEHFSISPTGSVTVGREDGMDSLNVNGPVYIWDTAGIDPLSIESNNAYAASINLSNHNTYQAASIGIRFFNANGIIAQILAGSPSNLYAPNGVTFHDLTGGGFDFVSPDPRAFVSWGSGFKAQGGTKMIFYNTPGHLIIGSTVDSGDSKLQVRGNTWTTGLTIPTGATAGYVLTSDAAGNASWQPGSSGHWGLANGTLFDSTENIAIGTSNAQGYKLAVNGTGMFTKIKVKPIANWPDYVFKKGYQLPGLNELERYIRRYNHLPGIASEEEVNKSGVDLGDQHAALLKKVEELTLYLIQQNQSLTEQVKQLNEQNTRLEAQQKEIDELKAMIQANKK